MFLLVCVLSGQAEEHQECSELSSLNLRKFEQDTFRMQSIEVHIT